MTAKAHLLEKQFAVQVYDLCDTLGWKRYHTYRSERSPAGYPDETLVRDRVIFAELKRDDTETTEAQKGWLRALRDAGAEVYVIRPRNLDALASVLISRGVLGPLAAASRVVLVEELERELA